MLHLHPLSEVTSRSEPSSVSSLELSASLGCCNHWIRTQIFHSNLTLRRDFRKMCQCHHYWCLKKLAKISLANVGATSFMYCGEIFQKRDMARNLDFEIKSCKILSVISIGIYKSLFSGQRFTSRDDKPYCADCFGELFSKRCTSCAKPITGQQYLCSEEHDKQTQLQTIR